METGRLRRAVEILMEFEEQGRPTSNDELLQQHPDLADVLGPMLDEHEDEDPADTIRDLDEPEDGPRRRVGPWEIIRPLGHGGMGFVFEARQIEPPHLRVALKLVRPDRAKPSLLRRFRLEREILARVQHESIARIYHTGEIEDGRPYYAMELLEGARPITTYADAHRLSVEQRLRLFLQVCDAVEFAHRRNIIHRDIKPSNVLVVGTGESARPKLIDFGLGKDFDFGQSTKTGATVLGTPAYMSPEQVFEADAIDHRTDVYSLGILLHELLAGIPPIDIRPGQGLEELRQIRDVTPAPISEAARDLSAVEMPDILRGRQYLSVQDLSRKLRGELDRIVAKSLSKQRERRYQTARDFAMDIRRHLEQKPVAAGRSRGPEPVATTVRRHGWLFALAGALIIVLAIAWWNAETRNAPGPELSELAHEVADLRRRAEECWPLTRAGIRADLRSWIEDAEALVPCLAKLDADLAAIRERALPRTEEERVKDSQERLLQGRLDEAERELRQQDLHREALGERSEQIERELERLRAFARDARESIARKRSTWSFENDGTGELKKRHAYLMSIRSELGELLEGSLEARDPTRLWGPSLPEMRRRLQRSEEILARSIESPEARTRWSDALEDIAQSNRGYPALRLSPIPGLLPLQRNPRTELWEFWHVASGDEPLPSSSEPSRWVITESTGLVFVLVAAFEGMLGSPIGAMVGRNDTVLPRSVRLAPYLLSKYECTQGQWARLTGEHPSVYNPLRITGLFGRAPEKLASLVHPMENVPPPEIFVALRRAGLELPTGVQWEHACRAGSQTNFWTGNRPSSLAGAANLVSGTLPLPGTGHQDAAKPRFDDGYLFHAPVGSFRANPFGLHDVHGNVFELVRDRHSLRLDEIPPRDGDGLVEDPVASHHEIRGGGFNRDSYAARSSARLPLRSEQRDWYAGVRPALDVRPWIVR